MCVDVDRWLAAWELGEVQVGLVARRENTVYRIMTGDGASFALRVRRVGHRTGEEIDSELDWMTMLACENMRVPVPVTTREGRRTVRVGEQLADLVTWLGGYPLGASGQALELDDPTATFRALGRCLAHLHLLSDAWKAPPDFERPAWDIEGLVGQTPLWGRFWDRPGLDASDSALFEQLRDRARVVLNDLDPIIDYGLIHADPVRENVLVAADDPTALALIDFDDGGFGYRLFDVATALGKNVDEPDFPILREALLAGYRELRELDTRPLALFMALRAATYVGWSSDRLNEAGGQARVDRAIDASRRAAHAWLDEEDARGLMTCLTP